MPPSRRLDADRLAAAYERDDAVGAARRPRPGGRRRRRPGRGRWLVPPKPAAPPRGEHRGAGRAAPSNCRAAGKRPGSAPPSDALKRAFGILRRERTGDEAPPAPALKAIERRGWEVVDPSATRLLRADRRARAWVVPAPDVAPMPSIVGRGAAASVRDQARTRARARARARARGRARGRAGGPPAVVAAAKLREGSRRRVRRSRAGRGRRRAADLQPGLAPPSVDPCAGANRDMAGVSGMAPDGVEAVFVIAADGSATGAECTTTATPSCSRSPRADSRYLV